jgi:hypothetical protein
MLALPLAWSAQLAAEAGDLRAARAGYESALGAARVAGHLGFVGMAERGLGDLALREGDLEQAAARYVEDLALQRRMGRRQGVAQDLVGLSAVAVARGEPARAARLLGAAEGLREAAGVALDAAERVTHDRTAAAARAALGEDAFAAAQTSGEELTLEGAVAEALKTGRSGRSGRSGT